MSDEANKDVIKAAEEAMLSLEFAKQNIERYLALHGLSRGGRGGDAAEFNMGNLESKKDLDKIINQSVDLAMKRLESFLASQPK